MLKSLSHDIEKGNQRYIRVCQIGDEARKVEAEVSRIRIAEVAITLRDSLEREFRNQFGTPEAKLLAELVHHYLADKLPETLTLKEELSNQARLEAVSTVKPATVSYDPSFGALVPIGKTLDQKELSLLRSEHDAYTKFSALPNGYNAWRPS